MFNYVSGTPLGLAGMILYSNRGRQTDYIHHHLDHFMTAVSEGSGGQIEVALSLSPMKFVKTITRAGFFPTVST